MTSQVWTHSDPISAQGICELLSRLHNPTSCKVLCVPGVYSKSSPAFVLLYRSDWVSRRVLSEWEHAVFESDDEALLFLNGSGNSDGHYRLDALLVGEHFAKAATVHVFTSDAAPTKYPKHRLSSPWRVLRTHGLEELEDVVNGNSNSEPIGAFQVVTHYNGPAPFSIYHKSPAIAQMRLVRPLFSYPSISSVCSVLSSVANACSLLSSETVNLDMPAQSNDGSVVFYDTNGQVAVVSPGRMAIVTRTLFASSLYQFIEHKHDQGLEIIVISLEHLVPQLKQLIQYTVPLSNLVTFGLQLYFRALTIQFAVMIGDSAPPLTPIDKDYVWPGNILPDAVLAASEPTSINQLSTWQLPRPLYCKYTPVDTDTTLGYTLVTVETYLRYGDIGQYFGHTNSILTEGFFPSTTIKIAVGGLPAQNLAELELMLDKIFDYAPAARMAGLTPLDYGTAGATARSFELSASLAREMNPLLGLQPKLDATSMIIHSGCRVPVFELRWYGSSGDGNFLLYVHGHGYTTGEIQLGDHLGCKVDVLSIVEDCGGKTPAWILEGCNNFAISREEPGRAGAEVALKHPNGPALVIDRPIPLSGTPSHIETWPWGVNQTSFDEWKLWNRSPVGSVFLDWISRGKVMLNPKGILGDPSSVLFASEWTGGDR